MRTGGGTRWASQQRQVGLLHSVSLVVDPSDIGYQQLVRGSGIAMMVKGMFSCLIWRWEWVAANPIINQIVNQLPSTIHRQQRLLIICMINHYEALATSINFVVSHYSWLSTSINHYQPLRNGYSWSTSMNHCQPVSTTIYHQLVISNWLFPGY